MASGTTAQQKNVQKMPATTVKIGASDVATVTTADLLGKTATDGAKRGRMKKEDAPFNIYFINEKNESSSRVPDNVAQVQVKGSDNKVKSINLADIPEHVLQKFIADGVKKRLITYISGVKKTNIAELYTLTDKFISDVKSGAIYAKKEEGGPGRSFDYDFWLDVAKMAAEIKVKNKAPKARLMTDDDRKGLQAKLEAMTPKVRNESIKTWTAKDKVIKLCAIKLRNQRNEEKLGQLEASDFDITAEL